jgi:glycosyltransferase involved in cell wall biosynthesis
MTSIVIPACNEESVISRTLKAMTDGANSGELEIVVICNGCTDRTAAIARSFGHGVRVVETKLAGKAHALNLGDEATSSFPRIYSDADVILPLHVIRCLSNRLATGDVLAVAPTSRVDLTGCSWSVRAYYAIRALLPSGREGIGGSGVYAVSEAGRRRFCEFPKVTADDGFVRIQFSAAERETLASVSSIVFAPRALKDLIITKTRSQYGSLELAKLFPELWKNKGEDNNMALAKLFKYPRLWPKLIVYCLVTITAKRRARNRLHRGNFIWQRDETSRVAQNGPGLGAGQQQ